MDGNGLALVQARTKIFALEHTCQPIVRTNAYDVFGGHFAEPFAVVANLGFFAIEDFENLLEISLCICVDLFSRQGRAGFRYARGVANHRGEIADQKDGGVAKILKVFELAKDHGMAQMKIRRRGVHAEINAQGLAGFQGLFEFGFEFCFRDDFSDAFFQVGELFFNGFEFCWGHESNSGAPKHAAAFNFIFSLEDHFHCLRINPMFFLKDFF